MVSDASSPVMMNTAFRKSVLVVIRTAVSVVKRYSKFFSPIQSLPHIPRLVR